MLGTGPELVEGKLSASWLKGVELHGDRRELTGAGVRLKGRDRLLAEGSQWRVMVSPGLLEVRYSDPARAHRAAQRQAEAAESRLKLALIEQAIEKAVTGGNQVTKWSAKSRRNMVKVLNRVDWTQFMAAGRPPVMVTLTYPGEWLKVAPNSAAATRHIDTLKRRYLRDVGTPVIGVWKREFQRRGAPHYHLLLVPPAGFVKGRPFSQWLAATWSTIVGAESCGMPAPLRDNRGAVECCERHRHLVAGTGIDPVPGSHMTDPQLVASYFLKHGAYAEKEYQNEAPAEWVEQGGSVGRFWGVWGLDRATAGVLVEPADAIAIARTMRRYSRAQSELVRLPMWRYRTVVDVETGEVSAVYRRGSKRRRLFYCRDGRAGFLVARDAPSLAADLARHVDELRRPERVERRSGCGPRGFLP